MTVCIEVKCCAVLKNCLSAFQTRPIHFVAALSVLLTVVYVALLHYFPTRDLLSVLRETVSVTGTLERQRVDGLGVASTEVTNCSISLSGLNFTNGSRQVIEVQVDGNFSERVWHFNIELQRLRCQLRAEDELQEGGSNTTCRTSKKKADSLRVVSGINDNYIGELADNPDIITVALLWLRRSRSNWNSLTDFSNLLYQRYFDWTADHTLCSWIKITGTVKMLYDSKYNRTCSRNINDSALATSLQPLYLNAKPIYREYYWPNNAISYPAHVYTDTPTYVFHMHIHRDAVVTTLGDVITARTKLVLYTCNPDITATSPRDENIPCYDEVYVITRIWGAAVYHRMVEVVPRLVFALHFLKAHPEIRIVGPEVGGRLAELLEIIGLDRRRLVTGPVRAKIVYQPRTAGCSFVNVQESQMLSQLYRDYIRRTFPPQPRNRLILIRRSGRHRRFAEQKAIEDVLKRVARDYNLTYTMFIDNPTPSLNDTMVMFHSAVVIVGPHGAGMSNMLFCQPGTYVVEGVCNPPHVILCFQRLAHVLGHHWHGVASRSGCVQVVDVAANKVEDAVRSYLRLWTRQQSLLNS